MQKFNAFETLSKIGANELQSVADQLNQTGFATDEDGLCLGSMLIEHWSDECTEVIRGYGYAGGRLAVSGDFFPGVGALYVLYDKGRHNGQAAADELRRVAGP